MESKSKSKWGIWIVVSFIIFAGMTFTMVYISMNSKVDLVTDNYYEKELKYQEHINMVKSTNDLSEKISLDFTQVSVVISFPKIDSLLHYSGTVFFFRPSDQTQDFTRQIQLDSFYAQTIFTDQIQKGMWRIKISWNVRDQQFYYEQPVIIQ